MLRAGEYWLFLLRDGEKSCPTSAMVLTNNNVVFEAVGQCGRREMNGIRRCRQPSKTPVWYMYPLGTLNPTMDSLRMWKKRKVNKTAEIALNILPGGELKSQHKEKTFDKGLSTQRCIPSGCGSKEGKLSRAPDITLKHSTWWCIKDPTERWRYDKGLLNPAIHFFRLWKEGKRRKTEQREIPMSLLCGAPLKIQNKDRGLLRDFLPNYAFPQDVEEKEGKVKGSANYSKHFSWCCIKDQRERHRFIKGLLTQRRIP